MLSRFSLHTSATHTHTSLEVSGECVVSASLCYVPSCYFSDFFLFRHRAREREECVNCFCMSMTQKKKKNPGQQLKECRLDSHPKNGRWFYHKKKITIKDFLLCVFCVIRHPFWVELFGTDGKCKESKEIRPLELSHVINSFWWRERMRGNAPVYKYTYISGWLAGFFGVHRADEYFNDPCHHHHQPPTQKAAVVVDTPPQLFL